MNSNIEIRKLGELANHISSGSTPLGGRSVYLDEGPVMLIRSQNVRMNHLQLDDVAFVSDEIDSSMKRSRLEPQDVLLNITGASIGRVARFSSRSQRANVNQHVCIIRTKHDRLVPRYLEFFLSSPIVQNEIHDELQRGGTRQALTFKQISEFKIPLPAMVEQERIADILDKANAIRRKRQQANKLAEQFLRSTFFDMFGDPITNPKGWPVIGLKNLISRGFQNGAYYPKEKYSQSNSGVEMVHMSDAFYGTVKLDDIKRVNASKSEVEKYSLDENDVLVARRSLNYEGSAKPCRVPPIGRHLIFESSLIRVTPDRSKLHPLYLYYFLSNPRARSKYVFRHVTRSTISGINQSGLGRVGIALPPIEEQDRFVAFHEHYDQSLNKLTSNADLLDDLFNSLVQRAFKGEL